MMKKMNEITNSSKKTFIDIVEKVRDGDIWGELQNNKFIRIVFSNIEKSELSLTLLERMILKLLKDYFINNADDFQFIDFQKLIEQLQVIFKKLRAHDQCAPLLDFFRDFRKNKPFLVGNSLLSLYLEENLSDQLSKPRTIYLRLIYLILKDGLKKMANKLFNNNKVKLSIETSPIKKSDLVVKSKYLFFSNKLCEYYESWIPYAKLFLNIFDLIDGYKDYIKSDFSNFHAPFYQAILATPNNKKNYRIDATGEERPKLLEYISSNGKYSQLPINKHKTFSEVCKLFGYIFYDLRRFRNLVSHSTNLIKTVEEDFYHKTYEITFKMKLEEFIRNSIDLQYSTFIIDLFIINTLMAIHGILPKEQNSAQ